MIRARAAEIGEAPGNSREQVPSGRECPGQAVSGEELFAILRDRFGLELEMEAGQWVTALSSIMDTEEGFARLLEAVRTLDEELSTELAGDKDGGSAPADDRSEKADSMDDKAVSVERSPGKSQTENALPENWGGTTPVKTEAPKLYQKTEAAMTIIEAVEAQHTWLPISEAEGRISGGFVFLYPPGIPILAPGERIPKQICDLLADIGADSHRVYGLREDFVCVCQ